MEPKTVLKKSPHLKPPNTHRPTNPQEFRQLDDSPSVLFRIYLIILKISRPVYRWAHTHWPQVFEKHLGKAANLDTSRMLPRFNAFYRLFFRRGFTKIRFDKEDLRRLETAYRSGPVIFLLKNWGQVEYNFFNDLFLQEKLPLVVHNNMVKMGHWMPWASFFPIHRQKVDTYLMTSKWPYNQDIFDLPETLLNKQPSLYCLDLPKGSPWVVKDLASQEAIIAEFLHAQEKLKKPIQLVPLHFLYDKHPGKEHKTLSDIILGDREHPGYLRKIILFLRNFKKRAVAKIGDPINFQELLAEFPQADDADKIKGILRVLQKNYQHETLQVTGPKLKKRRRLMEEILENPKLQKKLNAIAKTQNIPLEKVEQHSRKNLKEICSDINFTLVELWNYFLSWLFNRFYDGVIVDERGIAKIKNIAKNGAVILVPSHKSHIDYLIFSYVFYHQDLSLPLVCAGNNLSFWPLGPVFRRSGAYFIRRSFAGDPIYAETLKAYVTQLMRDRSFQEFFIEGTRSRSGKLFPPRLGMLRMMVSAFLEEKDIPDVYFLPASIDYERVIEEGAYLDEVKGHKKEKERFRDLLSLPRFLRKRYGKVYVQFAEPISLKSLLKERSRELLSEPEVFNEFTKNLGAQISHAINDVTTLLPASLVAMALLYPRTRSITSKELHQKCTTLYQIAQHDGPRISESLTQNFHHAIQEAINQFTNEGLIQRHESMEEIFYAIPEDARLPLDFYKNRGVHTVINPILKQRYPQETLATEAKQLLVSEFFFSKATQQTAEPLPTWVLEIIQPTLESYWLTLHVCEKLKFKKIEEWLLLRKTLDTGKLLLIKGELKFPECLSRFNIQNAIAQMTQLGVLQNHSKEMGPKGRKHYSPGASSHKKQETRKLLEKLLKPITHNP